MRPLTTPFAQLGIVGGLAGILFLTYRRYNAATAFLFGSALVPIVTFAYFFLTNCISGGGGGEQLGLGGDVVSNSQGGLSSAPSVPPTLIGLLFGGVMIAAVVMLFTMTGDEETVEPVEDEPDEPETADFARAAGRAADRIEKTNATVDNAVYRAWLEMTGLLDIENPEATAPIDFAEEAIAIGLHEDDVSELTELFNEVRYGGKSAEDREERAIEILRNIEETYQESVEPREGGA